MSQILALLYSLVDGKSSAHTYLGAVGLFGLALYQFSLNDTESAAKQFALGLGLLGIARKQAATAHVVTAVSVATGAVPPAPAPK